MPKFEAVFCSQCGRGFGPGDHGYSSCHEHNCHNCGARMVEVAPPGSNFYCPRGCWDGYCPCGVFVGGNIFEKCYRCRTREEKRESEYFPLQR